jgi:competence protein ComEA
MILRKLNLLVEPSMSESVLKATGNQSPRWNVARASAAVCILIVASFVGVNSALAQTDEAADLASTEMSKLNINTADAESLAANLVGIGLTKAQEIVRYRELHGDFVTIEELSEVKGVGLLTEKRIAILFSWLHP